MTFSRRCGDDTFRLVRLAYPFDPGFESLSSATDVIAREGDVEGDEGTIGDSEGCTTVVIVSHFEPLDAPSNVPSTSCKCEGHE